MCLARYPTCVASSTARVLVAVIVLVLSGEHHPCLIGHCVGQVSHWLFEVDLVVALSSPQMEVVLYEALAKLPVLHFDAEDGVATCNQSMHLLEA